MSHIYETELLIEDSGERHVRFTNAESDNTVLASKDDFASMMTRGRATNEDHTHPLSEPDQPPVVFLGIPDGTTYNGSIPITQVDFLKVQNFFHPGLRAFNPETDGLGTDSTTTEELPELQLVQDPVIYNRPETGYSQESQHFFRFHNPNGKSAITIPMTNVDYTRFDSLNDDTHHYVVVTKSRIEVRCVSTVNEQLGLEFRFRGVTHITSAEESNNVRQITESRANPT